MRKPRTLALSAKQPEPKRLPEANEFSPGQIKLRTVLELAATHAGDRNALVESIRKAFFATSASRRSDMGERLKQQQTRANNVLIGMKGYGLFDLKASRLTPSGEALRKVSGDAMLNEAFASQILRVPANLEVLAAVRKLQANKQRPTKALLQGELESRGFKLPRATTHHTKLLQWLREAGVVDKDNNVDMSLVAKLTGISLEVRDEWLSLPREQRAFLWTLRRLTDGHGAEPIPAQAIVTEAKFEHGPIFREDQLSRNVFKPLEDAGWITRALASGGRGGKSGLVAPTKKLLDINLDLLPIGDDWGVPPELQAKLDKPLSEVLSALTSASTHEKGIALELLALRLAVDAGLTPLRFRLRAAETGGAEVDLVAEGAHLHFSRWLFQCKNTKTVHLTDLAKEVGMAIMLRAHVIVLVTTGKFASSVQRYATELMDTQHLQVVLVGNETLKKYREGGITAIVNVLHETALETMRLKRAQVVGPLEDSS